MWERACHANTMLNPAPTFGILNARTAVNRLAGDLSGGEAFFDFALYSTCNDRIATGENVDRCVSVLWPGVDGDVAFGDDDYSGEAVWTELMEDGFDHGGPGGVGGFDEGCL